MTCERRFRMGLFPTNRILSATLENVFSRSHSPPDKTQIVRRHPVTRSCEVLIIISPYYHTCSWHQLRKRNRQTRSENISCCFEPWPILYRGINATASMLVLLVLLVLLRETPFATLPSELALRRKGRQERKRIVHRKRFEKSHKPRVPSGAKIRVEIDTLRKGMRVCTSQVLEESSHPTSRDIAKCRDDDSNKHPIILYLYEP